MKKLKSFTILLFSILSISEIIAQQGALSTGGNVTGTGGSISYSIGQVANINVTGINGQLTEGIQQPFEIVTLGKDNFPEITLQMSVYPNPTNAFVNLKIEKNNFENLQYQLIDLNGKQIELRKITETETQITLENQASAIYLLNVYDINKLVKTFKIIKNN